MQQEVARQAKASVTDSHGEKITPLVACVEDTNSNRGYACTVKVKVGSGKYFVTTKPQTVHATVSKDGKKIVVEGL